MTLIGKWFITGEPVVDTNGQFAIVGQFVAMVGADCLLAQIRPSRGPAPMMLLHIEYLAGEATVVFNSEAEMDAWLNFESKPGKLLHLPLPKKDPS